MLSPPPRPPSRLAGGRDATNCLSQPGRGRRNGTKPPRSSRLLTRATHRVSYGVAGCTRILIRKNNNLSKICMICVFFPDSIYIGIIHQLAWHWPEESEENKNHKKQQPGQKPPLGIECCLPSSRDPSPLCGSWGCSSTGWVLHVPPPPSSTRPLPTPGTARRGSRGAGPQERSILPPSSRGPAQKAPRQRTGTFDTCLGQEKTRLPKSPKSPCRALLAASTMAAMGTRQPRGRGQWLARPQPANPGTGGRCRRHLEGDSSSGKEKYITNARLRFACDLLILSNRSKRRLGSTPLDRNITTASSLRRGWITERSPAVPTDPRRGAGTFCHLHSSRDPSGCCSHSCEEHGQVLDPGFTSCKSPGAGSKPWAAPRQKRRQRRSVAKSFQQQVTSAQPLPQKGSGLQGEAGDRPDVLQRGTGRSCCCSASGLAARAQPESTAGAGSCSPRAGGASIGKGLRAPGLCVAAPWTSTGTGTIPSGSHAGHSPGRCCSGGGQAPAPEAISRDQCSG